VKTASNRTQLNKYNGYILAEAALVTCFKVAAVHWQYRDNQNKDKSCTSYHFLFSSQ